MNLRNPKQTSGSRRGRSAWYPYYAGFSPDFVADALCASRANTGSAVLDPWNGGGTTTSVAAHLGFDAIGFDLNPAMVIVAKARALQADIHSSLPSLLEDIVQRASRSETYAGDEPLLSWFSPRTAAWLRAIELSIRTVLVESQGSKPLAQGASLSHVSPLAAFFYVAAFRVIGELLKPFRSSNPTWLKNAESRNQRIRISKSELTKSLRETVANMCADLLAEHSTISFGRNPHIQVEIASSTSLPVVNNSIDLVLTSPPYCTRIDYAIKTAPELALLGMDQSIELRTLRDQMIGTPTIASSPPPQSKTWGTTCIALLDQVSNHGSRASKSYYLKTHLQYFDAIYKSLSEIDRVLSRRAESFFVVQDSYYKELRMDLAQILIEMGTGIGWSCDSRLDFESRRTMVGVNRGARIYNNPPKPAFETVLHFRKEG